MLHNQDLKSKEEIQGLPDRETAHPESEFHIFTRNEKGRLSSGLPFLSTAKCDCFSRLFSG